MANNEIRERNKVARESLGKFFYDLAKVIFTAMVASSIIALFAMDNESAWTTIGMLILGCIFTFILAYAGNYILKH